MLVYTRPYRESAMAVTMKQKVRFGPYDADQ
jgi:hypothetical protein